MAEPNTEEWEIDTPGGPMVIHTPVGTSEADAIRYARQQWEKGTRDQGILDSLDQAAWRGITGMVDAAGMATNMMAGRVSALPGGSQNVSLMDKAADAGLTYRNLEELPREHRPAAVATETFTGAMLPGGLAARTVAPASRTAFLAKEVGLSAGAAQMGAIAEIISPSNPWVRSIMEIGGGLGGSPTALISRLSSYFKRGGQAASEAVLPALTQSTAKDRGAEIMQRVARDAGEDPDNIARLLDDVDPDGLTLTTAQKSNSEAMASLTDKVAESVSPVGPAIDKARVEALNQLRATIDTLSSTGNPEAVRAAAALRQQHIRRTLQSLTDKAKREADAARAAVGGGGREGEIAASVQQERIINQAWDDAIDTQSKLWEAIPDNVSASADDTLSAYRTVRAEMLKDDSIDPVLEATFSRFSGNRRVQASNPASELQSVRSPAFRSRTQTAPPETPTSGDLKNIRSRARAMNRQARAAGDGETAHRYRLIAEGADSDLMKLDLPGAEEARAFTRSMHEAFTQTFARDVIRETPVGGDRMAPEVTLSRAFGPQTGGAQAGVNLRQLQRASEFPPNVAAETGPASRVAQEQFIRSRAGGMTRPGSESLNPNQLDKLVSNNPETMGRFPQVSRDISRAAQAERNLTGAMGKDFPRQKEILGRVMGADDPVAAVGDILSKKSRSREFLNLARLIRKSGPEATEGLTSATLQSEIQKAMGKDGLSFTKLHDSMVNGGVFDLMQRAGLLENGEHAANVRRIITRGMTIEKNALSGDARSIQKLLSAPDQALNFLVRILSIKVGQKIHGAMGGLGAGELTAAGAASRTGLSYFNNVPTGKVMGVLAEAVLEPRFAAELLRRPTTVAGRRAQVERINGFLIQAGLVEPSQQDEGDFRRLGQSLNTPVRPDIPINR